MSDGGGEAPNKKLLIISLKVLEGSKNIISWFLVALPTYSERGCVEILTMSR